MTKKEDLLVTRGTMKAAVLVGDSSCPSLVAASLYDSKPVYLISNACNKVEWTKKERKRNYVWLAILSQPDLSSKQDHWHHASIGDWSGCSSLRR